MAPADWLLLSLTLLAGAASPGASLALVMQRALHFGRRAGMLVGLSHGLGILLYAGAVALGAAELQSAYPQTFNALQIIGLVFLAYLGLSMLRGGWRTRRTPSAEQTAQPPSQHPLGFAAEGFLIVFLNPKIAIFFFAIFSQFLATDLSLATRLTMASLAGTIDALWYCAIAALVSLPFVQTRLREYAWQLDIAFGAALLVIMLLLI
ncbi:MAG: LysE family translocator [Pseudomonadota bacterium]|nr:LysE family translocator [Pseudomonadota bacterium]